MKRVTYWPQVWLGLSASAGMAVAWQHIVGSLEWEIIAPFAVAIVCWVIHFDSVYASQDRADDIKANIGSTAVLFGSHIRSILTLFCTSFCVLLAYVGYLNNNGVLYYLFAVGSAIIHMGWQLSTVDFEDKRDVMGKFISNGTMGYFIWGGMVADYISKVVFSK